MDILPSEDHHPFEDRLLAERPRLVRRCARWDAQNAEDLAQETLARAWRYQQCYDPRHPLRPWLDAIAHNVCRSSLQPQTQALPEEYPTSTGDPLAALEKAALLELLHEALDALPAPTREILLARYVQEVPANELARRLQVSDDTLSVRLHRGRQALRRMLAPKDNFPDIETDLWCLVCGQRKLRGGFYVTPDGTRKLELRCSECYQVAQSRFVHVSGEAMLGNLTTLRPATKRAMRQSHRFWSEAQEHGQAHCPHCRRMVPLKVGQAPGIRKQMPMASRPALILHCNCGHLAWQWADGFVYGLPEVQRLWSRHERLRLRFPADGVLRIEALTSAAAVEVRTDPQSFLPLEIRTEGVPTP